MRWLFTPDCLSIFTDESGRCGHYDSCDCYCPPLMVKTAVKPPQ